MRLFKTSISSISSSFSSMTTVTGKRILQYRRCCCICCYNSNRGYHHRHHHQQQQQPQHQPQQQSSLSGVLYNFSKSSSSSSLSSSSSFSSSSSSSFSTDNDIPTNHNNNYHNYYDIYDTKLMKDDMSYCMNLVKERDYENGYICGLLLSSSSSSSSSSSQHDPHIQQNAYYALRAWNIEIASIKDTSRSSSHSSSIQQRRSRIGNNSSSNDDNNNNTTTYNDDPFHALSSTGHPPPSIFALQLRMQWWKNALNAIYQNYEMNNYNKKTNSQQQQQQHTMTTTSLSSQPPQQPPPQPPPENPIFTTISTDTSSYWKNPVIRSLHRALTLQQQHQSQPSSSSSLQQPSLQQPSLQLWTKRFLERIIEARESDLYIDQYTTILECCNYADETISNLLLLSLESCSSIQSQQQQQQPDLMIDEDLITSAAIGIGLTTLLRATPYRLLLSSSSSSSSSIIDMPLPSELFRPNFPYHNIIPTFFKEKSSNDTVTTTNASTQSSFDQLVPSDIDPVIRMKLQRHLPNDQLSIEDQNEFYNAVRTITDLSQHHLSIAVRALQRQPNNNNNSDGQLHRSMSSVEKLCFLSIIPCQKYIYQLQHRYKYDIFRYMKEQQTNPYQMAKDRIHLFYQLGRTYVTGKYY